MSQYCIYLRKSRADQELEAIGQGETLARHEKALLALAKQQQLSISAIYKEIVSGETISARPIVQQLLGEVAQGVWSGVLVMEVERLARGNTIDQGIMAQTFQISGTKIITPMRTYDPNNEADEEYFEFNLFMSRREYKTINRRIQRGRIASVKEGKYISSVAPYGYDRVKLPGKGYSLKPNEQAETVKLIFELYVNGLGGQMMGCARIANYLDTLGIKPMHLDSWSRASVSDILQNPVYKGIIRWGNRKDVKQLENGVIKITRPTNPDSIEVKGLHKPLISEELYEAAANIRKMNLRPPVNGSNSLTNPLAGIVYCGKCGKVMGRLGPKADRKSSFASLRCNNRHCDNISANLALVETEILNALDKWLTNFEISHKDAGTDSPIALTYSADNGIKQLNTRLLQLQKQLDTTYTLLEQEVYSVEVFAERHSKITSGIKECEDLLNELQKNKINIIDNQEIMNDFVPQCHHVLDIYNMLPDAQSKNELLKTILAKVVYVKDKPCSTRDKGIPAFELELYPAIPRI